MSEHAHATSAKAYWLTWLALVVLTVVTYAVSRIELGAFQIWAALVIATTKGTLVVLIFMHLYEQRSVNRIFILVATGFVVLLIALMLGDVMTRTENVAVPSMDVDVPLGR